MKILNKTLNALGYWSHSQMMEVRNIEKKENQDYIDYIDNERNRLQKLLDETRSKNENLEEEKEDLEEKHEDYVHALYVIVGMYPTDHFDVLQKQDQILDTVRGMKSTYDEKQQDPYGQRPMRAILKYISEEISNEINIRNTKPKTPKTPKKKKV